MVRSSLMGRFCVSVLILSLFASIGAAIAPVPGNSIVLAWKIQSSSKAGNNTSNLFAPDFDLSSWHAAGSKSTLMATLLDNKVYNDTELFLSTNLQKVDYSQFQVPWYYRSEFNLGKRNGSYYQLRTNGITSRADIWVNGKEVANKDVQVGSYVGFDYDITSLSKEGKNVVLVRVYPTDYNRDFALGFVDWNPYPPDNGTGIWRDVVVKQTGPVSLSTPRALTTLDTYQKSSDISIKVDVRNLANTYLQGEVTCKVSDSNGTELGSPKGQFKIQAKAEQTVTLSLTLQNPQVWWPAQWGSQPLYTAQCTASTPNSNASCSDTTTTKFGIRTVASKLDSNNATSFYVNGKPFQVLGGGYTSDIFLRFSPSKLRTQFAYMIDMGLNTMRLEGKQEHPELYNIADELGVMVLAGWECCDKWEGWTYNDDGSGVKWINADYTIANNSMRHEAAMMQAHPSMLAFLVGSDYWPDDRATPIYLDALKAFDWDVPIIASASQRGYPKQLGDSGMKMLGPYDWVPPNYWYGEKLGAAFGFGSELGTGVGTPELSSLKKFLSASDLEDLWKAPNKGLYHMSQNTSSFHTREIYNTGLWNRYGAPASLSSYLLKAQMADYEATRAQYEAYASRWSASVPASGLIYWMLNNAWPSLHWNLFDYYLHTAGAYYGVKTASRIEHVAYDYAAKGVYLINRSLSRAGMRTIEMELLSLSGAVLGKTTIEGQTAPNTSKFAGAVPGVHNMTDVALLKLVLHNRREVLSRNVYWLSSKQDVLDWDNSTWYHTPVTSFADFSALDKVQKADVAVSASRSGKVVLENKAKVPAVFVRLNLVDAKGDDVLPATWSDNYVTLWPGEKLNVEVKHGAGGEGLKVEVSGVNVESRAVNLGDGY